MEPRRVTKGSQVGSNRVHEGPRGEQMGAKGGARGYQRSQEGPKGGAGGPRGAKRDQKGSRKVNLTTVTQFQKAQKGG